jgi:lysophospholipase L1-like esterase
VPLLTTLRRPLLAASLVVAFVLVADARQSEPNPTRHRDAIEAFREWDAKNTVPQNAVLFVGSSTIRLWPTARQFPDTPVINRGFGGSHISEINHYVDDVATRYRAAVVVFYAGDNDIDAGKTPERVLADYRWFVTRVRATRSDTQFIFLAIKPSIARWAKWPLMQRANALIRDYSAAQPGLHFADVATPMLTPAGRTQPSLYEGDGLHMTAAGYDLWTRVLFPIIARARAANR